VRSGKSSKYEENEYKSSLGCLRQKPIGALNLARIGGDVKPKQFLNVLLKNWLGLERAQNMRKRSISRVWVVLDNRNNNNRNNNNRNNKNNINNENNNNNNNNKNY
jgi:hypothetical protein